MTEEEQILKRLGSLERVEKYLAAIEELSGIDAKSILVQNKAGLPRNLRAPLINLNTGFDLTTKNVKEFVKECIVPAGTAANSAVTFDFTLDQQFSWVNGWAVYELENPSGYKYQVKIEDVGTGVVLQDKVPSNHVILSAPKSNYLQSYMMRNFENNGKQMRITIYTSSVVVPAPGLTVTGIFLQSSYKDFWKLL